MLPQPLHLSDGIIKNYVGKYCDNYVHMYQVINVRSELED